jgi:hypothetical protein
MLRILSSHVVGVNRRSDPGRAENHNLVRDPPDHRRQKCSCRAGTTCFPIGNPARNGRSPSNRRPLAAPRKRFARQHVNRVSTLANQLIKVARTFMANKQAFTPVQTQYFGQSQATHYVPCAYVQRIVSAKQGLHLMKFKLFPSGTR